MFNTVDCCTLPPSLFPREVGPAEIALQDLHAVGLHPSRNTTSAERCIARSLRSLTVWMLLPSSATLEQLTALESLVIGGLPTKPLTLDEPSHRDRNRDASAR
ncbi:hypothetical protein FA95DRAFT_1613531 [Auriscalpium vulgare]|uniref:Uncharacterized protein n=1 Tax=Auriscalpium vulgare TaxID=40419 RepID=A0ACB8R2B5_9AGAM|nr:hypothetical protein FA95DRAFT_1613531 [Auriscalpium vulgare]